MSDAGSHRQLKVEADLRLDIDGNPATISAAGRTLTLHTQSPAALLEAVTSVHLPVGNTSFGGARALGRIGDALGGAGLQFTVTGPGGPLLSLGAPAHSPLGRLVTGSDKVRVESLRAVLPLVVDRLRTRMGYGHVAIAAGSLILGLTAWRHHRARSQPNSETAPRTATRSVRGGRTGRRG